MMWRSKLVLRSPVVASEFRQFQTVSERMVWPELGVHLRPLIQSIKLPEFIPLEEARASLKAVWLTAIRQA